MVFNKLMMPTQFLSGVICLFLVVGTLGMNHTDDNDEIYKLSRSKRFINLDETDLWPKAIVPYNFSARVLYLSHFYLQVMAFIETETCIQYIPYTNTSNANAGLDHEGFLNFVADPGCWSLFPVKGARKVRISCCKEVACLHELGHSLGFKHEQQNPKRINWMTVNWDNIIRNKWSTYGEVNSEKYNDPWPFDISSPMLYETWEFSSGGPTMTMKFPELKFTNKWFFYFFMEISSAYKCAERGPCVNNTLKCVNDGYVSVVRGKCQCRCPQGLNPDTGCATIIKKVTNAVWPKGAYTILKSTGDCPASFQEGNVKINGITSSQSDIHTNKSYCSRTTKDETDDKFNWPIGTFCILRNGGTCPKDFFAAWVNFGESTTSDNSGVLPDMTYDTNVTLHICCQHKGLVKVPSHGFPTATPFTLFRNDDACQKIFGMHVTSNIVNYYGATGTISFESSKSSVISKIKNGVRLVECHYTPADMSCGEAITLDKTNRETVIEASSEGRTDLECSWLVKGDNSNGTLVIEPENFNLSLTSNGKCMDTLTIKHGRIGQPGKSFCGNWVKQPIRSIFDKVMIHFITKGSNSQSSIKLRIKWIPNEDLCYDANDNGMSYAGKVNYTRTYQPCIPWADVTSCPHHPFNTMDTRQSLEHNYCRNPDNSPRPWCFTSTTNCVRNFCDVCGLEPPTDHDTHCDMLTKRGIEKRGYEEMLRRCPKTFYGELFPTLANKPKFREIQCAPPIGPDDGNLIDEMKPLFLHGESVTYKCINSDTNISLTCLSDGQWSPGASACHDCAEDELLYNNACYKRAENGKYGPYATAVKYCQELGGHLPTPKDIAETKIIRQLTGVSAVWIGITYKADEGKWVDRNGKELTWTYWLASKKDDKKVCAVIRRRRNKWIEQDCTKTFAVTVCEIPRIQLKCRDFLEERCQTYLAENPDMCTDYPQFAINNCQHTCHICKQDFITNECNVTASLNNATAETTKKSVAIGETVTYSCTGDNKVIGGDAVRVCMPTGYFSGKQLQCGAELKNCSAPKVTFWATPIGVTKTSYFSSDQIQFQCKQTSCMFSSTCSSGEWSSVETKCEACRVEYKLLNKGTSYTYDQASKLCEKNKGVIAAPRNQAELDSILETGFTKNVWLAINDKTEEGHWVDNNDVQVTWTKWYDGEPKNAGANDDCVIADTKGLWRDVTCNSKRGQAVCALQVKNAACFDSLAHQCTNLLTKLPNMCQDYPDFTKANCPFTCGTCPYQTKKCSTVTSNENVQNLTTSDTIYIGETVEYNCSPNSYRANGFEIRACLPSGELTGTPLECNAMMCGEPKVPSGTEQVEESKTEYNVGDEVTFKCTQVNESTTGRCLPTGVWDIPAIICSGCRPTDQVYNGFCYRKVTQKKNHNYATVSCKILGGHLAAPKSEEEHNVIKNVSAGSYVWIGISDIVTNERWRYDDGSDLIWNNWYNPEAKYGSRGRNCAFLKGKYWSAINCGRSYQYVCAIRVENCEDELGTHCDTLLQEEPTLCQIVPEFTNVNCRKSCGVCVSKDIACTDDENKDPTVMRLAAHKPILSVGEFVDYNCVPYTHQSSGQKTRVCLPTGKLSDKPLKCKANCPADETGFGTSCYTLVQQKRAFTRQQAVQLCKNEKKILATPRSMEEAQFFRTLAGSKYVLLGLKYSSNQKKWLYEDGSEMTNLLDGIQKNTDKDCVVMLKGTDFTQVACTKRYNAAICSSKASDAAVPSCEDKLGHSCTAMLAQKPTLCTDQPKFVQDNCKSSCGICKTYATECSVGYVNKYVVSSTSAVKIAVGESITYSCSENTDRHSGNERRVCLQNGLLSGTPLKCEKCPYGFFHFNGACHGFMEPVTSYSDAQLKCNNLRGFLAQPRSPAEVDFFLSIAMGNDIFIDPKFAKRWTGISSTTKCFTMNKAKGIVIASCNHWINYVCSIPRSDPYVCYNPREKGSYYHGKVNYTDKNETCLTWAETAYCENSPFKQGLAINNLDGNYCRNPDNSLQPWCYTKGCVKQSCDVCMEDNVKDTEDHCWMQRDNGFCTSDPVNAEKQCADTCSDLIKGNGPGFYGDIVCKAPTVPSDGDLVGEPRSSYYLGETVSFKCKKNELITKSTCMSDGQWSETNVACSECPSGYTVINDVCYKHKAEVLDFNNAKRACEEEGTRLPTPNSLAENMATLEIGLNKTLWLDGTDVGNIDNFHWTDGTKAEWYNWNTGYPQESQCVILTGSGKWQTSICTHPISRSTVVCTTPKRTDITCQDLNSLCKEMLKETPTMCKDFHQISTMCPKSCGRCQ